MIGKHILIVEDNESVRDALILIIKKMDLNVDTAEDGKMGFEKASKKYYDLIISDMRMPHVDGLAMLKLLNTAGIKVPVAFITAYGTVENAVESLKIGAFDYLLKPFSAEAIEELVKRVFSISETKVVNREKKVPMFMNSFMATIFSFAEDIAKTDVTVLITGASGTGKDVLSEFIHQKSTRAKGPYIAVNCAALPDSLIESELFGYEKGAFTGADIKKPGKFELAHQGTILLDEIGEFPLHLQAKVLRAIEEKEIEKLGSIRKFKVDTRIIATTNRDLKQEVKKGNFREDLYYRLNVINIELPSLKDRKNDIMEMALFFIDKYSKLYVKKIKKLNDMAKDVLISYDWPGNIRELEHTIERAVILSKDSLISERDLFLHGITFQPSCGGFPNYMQPYQTTQPCISNTLNNGSDDERAGSVNTSSDRSIAEVERELILNTLKKYGGNRTKTAEVLGITVRTLRNKLNEYKSNGLNIDSY